MKQVKWQKVTEAECWEFESDAKKSIAMNSDSARAPGGGEGIVELPLPCGWSSSWAGKSVQPLNTHSQLNRALVMSCSNSKTAIVS